MHDGGFNTSFAKASYHCLRGLMLLMFLQPTFTLSKISDEQGRNFIYWILVTYFVFKDLSSYQIIIQRIFLLGNAASSEIKLNKRNGIEYVDSRSNYGQSDGYRLPIPTERLFNVPLRATPEAAGSPQCVACRARGRQCLIVRHTNHVKMFLLYGYFLVYL